MEKTSWFCAKLSSGKIPLTRNLSQVIPTLDTSPKRCSTRTPKKSHGSESSKSIPSSSTTIDSPLDHMDGHQLDTQVIRAHTTAPSEVMCASEEPWPTLIINVASMLESPSPVPMPRSCQDNGSTRLDHAQVSNKVTTSGLQDSSSIDALKSTIFPSH